MNDIQERNWLTLAGWASSNIACCRSLGAPSILPKTGWAIAHPVHPPVTPLTLNSSVLHE